MPRIDPQGIASLRCRALYVDSESWLAFKVHPPDTGMLPLACARSRARRTTARTAA